MGITGRPITCSKGFVILITCCRAVQWHQHGNRKQASYLQHRPCLSHEMLPGFAMAPKWNSTSRCLQCCQAMRGHQCVTSQVGVLLAAKALSVSQNAARLCNGTEVEQHKQTSTRLPGYARAPMWTLQVGVLLAAKALSTSVVMY
jgi:hypothetical protein